MLEKDLRDDREEEMGLVKNDAVVGRDGVAGRKVGAHSMTGRDCQTEQPSNAEKNTYCTCLPSLAAIQQHPVVNTILHLARVAENLRQQVA